MMPFRSVSERALGTTVHLGAHLEAREVRGREVSFHSEQAVVYSYLIHRQ